MFTGGTIWILTHGQTERGWSGRAPHKKLGWLSKKNQNVVACLSFGFCFPVGPPVNNQTRVHHLQRDPNYFPLEYSSVNADSI